MDVVCVQDSAGRFWYTEFYVKFKVPFSDQASLALIGATEDSYGKADVQGTLNDEAIASIAKKDIDQMVPPPEPAWIVLFVNGKQLDSVMAFVGLGQILHFYDPKTKQCFITPPQDYFRKFGIKPGKNKFLCWHRGTDTSVIFNLWWYDLHDRLVVMDIDGTITKSDLKGYIQTVYLGMFTYIHDGLVDFLDALSSVQNLKLVYLTSRPMGHRRETINLLRGIKGADGKKLPDGPLFTTKSRLMVALYKEVITRETAQLKSSMLQNVVEVFLNAGLTRMTPFVLGIGNKENDALAYNSIGLPGENILLINTNSRITIWKHSNFSSLTSAASSTTSSAANSRFSTPLKKTRSLNVPFLSGLTDAAMKAMAQQKKQSAGDTPQESPQVVGSPRLVRKVSAARGEDEEDEESFVADQSYPEDDRIPSDDIVPPLPPPQSPSAAIAAAEEPMLNSAGEEVVHFQSYSDPNLLKYVDRVVKAMIQQY